MSGLIKSLLYSDRPINPKNIKFDMLKEILHSEHLYSILEKRNTDMQKLINHYKKEIENEKSLKSAAEYTAFAEDIRKKRANKVLSGNSDKFAMERLKSMYEDKELLEAKKDRGTKHFRVKNDSLVIRITDLDNLMYDIKMMQIDVISSIITTYEKIPSYKLESWYEQIKLTNKLAYGKFPLKENGKLILGENSYKSEELLLYHCLTDDHIYMVKRIQFKA